MTPPATPAGSPRARRPARRGLRKVVAIWPAEQFSRLWLGPLADVAELRSVHILRYDEREFTAIVAFRPRPPDLDPRRLVDGATVLKCEVLSYEKSDERSEPEFSCLMRVRHRAAPIYRLMVRRPDLFVDPHMEVAGGEVGMALYGYPDSLERLVQLAGRMGIRSRLERLSAADVTRSALLASLSPRQREAIRIAHRLGYFERPKRVRLEKLAEVMGVDKSTVMEHLRLAEKKIFDAVL